MFSCYILSIFVKKNESIALIQKVNFGSLFMHYSLYIFKTVLIEALFHFEMVTIYYISILKNAS